MSNRHDFFSDIGFIVMMLLFLSGGENDLKLDELKERSKDFNDFLQRVDIPELEVDSNEV